MTEYAKLQPLFIALLDDDQGISEEAWNLMSPLVDDNIRDAVEATDGRFYLNEDFMQNLLNG